MARMFVFRPVPAKRDPRSLNGGSCKHDHVNNHVNNPSHFAGTILSWLCKLSRVETFSYKHEMKNVPSRQISNPGKHSVPPTILSNIVLDKSGAWHCNRNTSHFKMAAPGIKWKITFRKPRFVDLQNQTFVCLLCNRHKLCSKSILSATCWNSGGSLQDWLQKLISNSWGKHKANQYHDGDFIPDKI